MKNKVRSQNVDSDFPLINCVLERLGTGIIHHLVDDGKELICVLHKSRFAYLFMEAYNEYLIDEFVNYVGVIVQKHSYVHFYNISQSQIICKKFRDLGYHVLKRKRCKYTLSDLKNLSYNKKNSFIVSNLSHSEINRIIEIQLADFYNFWYSAEQLLKRGLPQIIIEESTEKIAGICYGAAVSSNEIEIDIKILPEYRGLGLSTYVAGEFIRKALKGGLNVSWDCFADNIASVKAAESLGFQQLNRYSFTSIYLEKKY